MGLGIIRAAEGYAMLSALSAITAVAVSLGDSRADLEAAAGQGARADSYAFSIEERPAKAVEGKYQKGRPAFFKADNIEFFRRGKALAYRQGGSWKRSKKGVESDPLAVLGASAKVRAARLPHEELADLAKHLQGVKKTAQKGGAALYEGTLTAEGAKALARSEHAGVARGGTARLWADAAGRPVKYEVTIRLRGRLGDAEVDGSTTRTVTLRAVGATKVEVPEEAAKALR
jgi:hypothetical protein